MALTTTPLGRSVPGNLARVRTVIAADASYPTGGYTITPALFGFQFLGHAVAVSFAAIPVGCAEYVYNEATGKLQFLVSAGTEVTNGTSLVGTLINMEGYGN